MFRVLGKYLNAKAWFTVLRKNICKLNVEKQIEVLQKPANLPYTIVI